MHSVISENAIDWAAAMQWVIKHDVITELIFAMIDATNLPHSLS